MKSQLFCLFLVLSFFNPVRLSAGIGAGNETIWKTVYQVPLISTDNAGILQPGSEAWSSAGFINRLYSYPQAVQTELDDRILMLYDGRNLIFNVTIKETGEDQPLKKCYLSNEPDLKRYPNLSIYLDPEHLHGMYYRFIIDAKGNKQDLCIEDDSWHTDWSARITGRSKGRVNIIVTIPLEGLGKQISDGDVWGFNITSNGLAGSGTLSSTPVRDNLTDASSFGHLVFIEKHDPGKLEGIKNTLPEFHQDQYKRKLEANTLMCGPVFIEKKGGLDQMEVGKMWLLDNGKKVTCLGLDNEPVLRSNYPFTYEKFENQTLHKLRNLYRLDEVVAAGKNDFEKMLLLNEWLVNHVTFGSPPSMTPNALHVLQNGLTGQTYNCTFLSFTLMQMYISLGYTARKITSVGHGTLDVWSDYWGKWFQIDPSRNSYYRMKNTGIPLNSHEIRREHWKNGGIDMEMVYGSDQRAERVTHEKRDRDGLLLFRTDGYQWVAYKSRNNFFEVPFTYWNFDYLILEDEFNKDKKWTTGNATDVREIRGTRTSRIEDVFWTLNQAYIHLYEDEGANVQVQLETVTPNFETFEYSVDGGEWIKTSSIFQWKLHEGQNALRARSVNKFGISGKEHKIILGVE